VDGGVLDPCSLAPKRGAAQTVTGRGHRAFLLPPALCPLPYLIMSEAWVGMQKFASLELVHRFHDK
ncbi:MAG: hypothetical protein ACREPR_08195, partial [Brasilonema sp.]